MNIENVNSFIDRLYDAALASGKFEDFQVKYSYDESMGLDIYQGEVSNYENSIGQKISLKAKRNGQTAGALISSLDESSIPWLIEKTASACDLLTDEDENFFYCDPNNSDLKCVQLGGSYSLNTYDRFKEIGLKLEKALLDADSRIDAVDNLSIGCSIGPTIMRNSKGLRMYTDSDNVSVYAGIRASENGIVKSEGKVWYGQNINDFDLDTFVNDIVSKVTSKFGASSVKSGNYTVILNNKTVISLFGAFLNSFSSYQMAKGLSVLNGKEGEIIASELLTLSELPNYDKALYKSPFDDEGIITFDKNIIERGVFNTALYNLKTEHMLGKKSTGNGFGGGIELSNILIVPGEDNMSLDELSQFIGNGLIITDISGLHAGLNPITGDFSLLSEGFLVTNGKIERAVEQITMSDNFFSLINRIKKVGGDVDKTLGGNGEFFAPSIVFENVSIAGED